MNQSKSISINRLDVPKVKMLPNWNFEKKLSVQILVTIVAFSLFIACKSGTGNNGEDETLHSISDLKIFDIENTSSATDVFIEFNQPESEDNIEEYRIFIVKSNEDLSLDDAILLSPDKYLVIPASEQEIYEFILPSGTLTVNGEEITNDSTYKAYVLSKSSDSNIESVISDESNDLILLITNLVDTIAENISAGTGGLSLDTGGNIFAGNFGLTFTAGGENVFRITPDGDVTEFASGLDGAAGNDFDEEGNLFQTNFSGGTISKIDSQGNVEEYIGQTNEINGPVGLVVDASGNLFVTNCTANSVIKINSEKTIETLASGSVFSCPNGITQDEEDNLYVTNFNNSTIVKIASDNTTSTFKTLPGGQVTHPFYSNGFIYAVSRGDLRIYRVSIESGEEEVIAGSGNSGTRTGAALDAEFVRLNDIAITPDGTTIYVNDTEPEAAADGRLGPVMIKRIRLIENNE